MLKLLSVLSGLHGHTGSESNMRVLRSLRRPPAKRRRIHAGIGAHSLLWILAAFFEMGIGRERTF